MEKKWSYCYTLDLHNKSVKEAIDLVVGFVYNILCTTNTENVAIAIIHGYGSSGVGGDIRREVRKLLERQPKRANIKYGEDVNGNIGATYLIPPLYFILRHPELDNIEGLEEDEKFILDVMKGKFTLEEALQERWELYIHDYEMIDMLNNLENKGVVSSVIFEGEKIYWNNLIE